jgi:hypothetical protein
MRDGGSGKGRERVCGMSGVRGGGHFPGRMACIAGWAPGEDVPHGGVELVLEYVR